MNLRHSIIQFYLSLFIIVMLTITICLTYPQAISAQSLNSLNLEITTLRTQIQRLESEVRLLRQSNSPSLRQSSQAPPPSSLNTPPAVIDGQIIGRSDPMFQKLATLVIELKEDVRKLQDDMQYLKKKVN